RRVARRHRADTPTRPELVAHQPVDDLVDAVRRDDAGEEQVPDVRAERVDLVLLPVERERVVAAPLLDPVRVVEPRPELLGLGLEALREGGVAPDLARELGGAALRVVDVALDLARSDRRARDPAVVEALRVA